MMLVNSNPMKEESSTEEENNHASIENISAKNEHALKKEEKNRAEAERLKNIASGGNIRTTKEKVALILNSSMAARNSDTDLTWEFWTIFQEDILGNGIRDREQLRKLKDMKSLTRERARIQNDYKLFQADVEVQIYRGVRRREQQEEAIEQKPNIPFYEIFIDESGKNDDNLIIGSLWIVDARSKAFALFELNDWLKELKKDKFEFHFAKMKPQQLELYKKFFLKFVSLNQSAGYKVIVLSNKGLKSSQVSNTITELTFHLINKGIEHEDKSLRAPLPRLLQVRFDAESEGPDQLKIENIRSKIKAQRIEGLGIDTIEAIPSDQNLYIQAVDLLTASVNRKLHFRGEQNHKDDLANYIVELIGFDIEQIDTTNQKLDRSTVFNLKHNKKSE